MTEPNASRLRHAGHPCRRAARSGHGRARDADLPDHVLRVRRRRPCGVAVRPAGLRQHLHAHRQPDQAVLEERVAALEGGTAALAVASGHAAQFLVFHALMQPGDEFIAVEEALWRLDQPVQPLLQELRLAGEVGRSRRPLDLRGGDHAEDQGDLHRVHRQSRRRHHRHRGHRRRSPSKAGVPLIVDNTLATPYLIQPVRARRRHHRALAHQVPRRPRQLHRRRHRRRRQVRLAARRAAIPCCRAAAGIWRHGAAARPSAISPSPSPAACSACATSARRSRRSTPS